MGTNITNDIPQVETDVKVNSFSSQTSHETRIEQLLTDATTALQSPEHDAENIVEILHTALEFAEAHGYALTSEQLQKGEKVLNECIFISENEVSTLDPIKASYIKADISELIDRFGLKDNSAKTTDISVLNDEEEFKQLIEQLRENKFSVSEAFNKFKELSFKSNFNKK